MKRILAFLDFNKNGKLDWWEIALTVFAFIIVVNVLPFLFRLLMGNTYL